MGNPETLMQTVSPTSKLVFGVVQLESKVSIDSPIGAIGVRTGLKAVVYAGNLRSGMLRVPGAGNTAFCRTSEALLFLVGAGFEADEDREKLLTKTPARIMMAAILSTMPAEDLGMFRAVLPKRDAFKLGKSVLDFIGAPLLIKRGRSAHR